MTDTTPSPVEPPAEAEHARPDNRPEQLSRLSHIAAWIGIVAGVVLSVAIIFFSGFFLGWSSGSHYGWHRGHEAGMDHSCSMMGEMKQPAGPMGPQQGPMTTAPASPRP